MDTGTTSPTPLTGETQNLLPPVLRAREAREWVADRVGSGAAPPIPTESPADSWIGKRIHHYAIEEFLGAGGMGRVYRGRHTWLELPVAIKILNPAMQADPTSLARFQREAQICARLTHPNIVRATDGGIVGNAHFLVTELVEGVTLTEYVQRHGPLDVANACYVIRETAAALQHAHERGLVHRDIKPSNLMLTTDRRIKLLDLGLARSSMATTELTSTGQIMGTVDYISPEQAADTRRVDARSDIYSLGCTFYFLLTGQAPFAGQAYDTAVSKILAHAEEDPPPLGTLRQGIAPVVADVVKRMTRKKLDERFATAQEVADILAPYAATSAFATGIEPASAVSTKSGATLADRFEAFSDQVLRGLWIGVRWLLLASGFLVREREPSRSRLQHHAPWVYRFSTNGFRRLFIAFIVFVGLSLFGIPQYFLGLQPPPIEVIEVR